MFFFATWVEVILAIGLLLLVRFVYNTIALIKRDKGLKKLGFDGPKISWLAGNMKGGDFFSLSRTAYKEFSHKKVFRFFMGSNPVLFVCNPDMIRQVLLKEFNHFVNHTPRPKQGNLKSLEVTLNRLRDKHWKRVRSAVSPTFTTGKLKKMSLRIEHTAKEVVKSVVEKQERNEEIELKGLFSGLTMDLVASVGFGMEVNSLKDPKNAFTTNAEKVICPANLKWQTIIGSIFPMLWFIVARFFGARIKEGVEFFERFVDVAFKNRKEESSQEQNDFLQIMVNAEMDGENSDGTTDQQTENTFGTSGTMTLEEIKGQALVFILAGYDTVSTALSFTMFLLAINPDCCKRVQEEIDQNIGRDVAINYENIQKLEYLEMCISEALRMYPPGAFLERQVKSDVEIQGIKFKAGLPVVMPMMFLQRDPKYWSEPDKFNPERFSKANKAARHPFVYLPFGQGPRNCIGMRLAQLELAITLASVLQRVTPVTCEKTVYPVEIASFNMRSKDGLWIKLEKR